MPEKRLQKTRDLYNNTSNPLGVYDELLDKIESLKLENKRLKEKTKVCPICRHTNVLMKCGNCGETWVL